MSQKTTRPDPDAVPADERDLLVTDPDEPDPYDGPDAIQEDGL